MKHSDKGWLGGAFFGISLVGLLVMLCGITLSLGFRTLSIISFFGVIVTLVIISFVKKAGTKPGDGD